MPLILAGVHTGGMMWSYYSYTYEEKILDVMVDKNSQGKCVENNVANNRKNGSDGNFARKNCRYDVRDKKEEN